MVSILVLSLAVLPTYTKNKLFNLFFIFMDSIEKINYITLSLID